MTEQTIDPAKYASVPVDEAEVPTEVPAQGSGYVPMLPFGIYTGVLPTEIPMAVREDVVDQGDGTQKMVPRWVVHFDRDHPITIEGGPADGHPLTEYVTNVPRQRRDGSLRPSALYFMVREGLNDATPIKAFGDWATILKRHGGKRIRIEVGGSVTCNEEKVRFLTFEQDGAQVTAEDPEGTLGCGARYYTPDIPKGPDGKAVERFSCACGASLRVFNRIERWMKPVGPATGATSGAATVAAGQAVGQPAVNRK